MAEASNQRIAIVVLGMHRSGTSALTRVLSLLGADLPKHVMGAAPGNPAGHWEPDQLVAIHERMLQEAGSGWDDWRAFDPAFLQAERLLAYRNEIADCLWDEFELSNFFVLKDPRVSRFVPFYEELLGQLGIQARYVLCLRDPHAVFASLSRRDAMSTGFAALLWLRHVLDAEAETRGLRRAIVSYEALMSNWQETSDHLAKELGLKWPADPSAVGQTVRTFLSPELNHHRGAPPGTDVHRGLIRWVHDTNDALGGAGAQLDTRTLDSVRVRLSELCDLVGDAAMGETYRRDGRISALEQALAAEHVRSTQVMRAFDEVVTSRSWRITKPLRVARELLARSKVRT